MNVHPDGLIRPELRAIGQHPLPPQRPPEYGYKDLFRFLLRRSRVILGVAAVIGAVVLAYSMVQPKQYTAKALLMISAP